MGENRNRIIWLENDVQDLKTKVQNLRNELEEATDFSTDIVAQNEAIEGLGDTISLFQDQIKALGAQVQALVGSNNFLATQHAKEWMTQIHDAARKASDSVLMIDSWQNQMSKDFTRALGRIASLEDKLKASLADKLKLASLADDRIRDLERQLAAASENAQGAVSRMEQLEIRLRNLEETQARQATLTQLTRPLVPRPCEIPVTIGPRRVTLPKPECRPGEIQCSLPLLDDEELDN